MLPDALPAAGLVLVVCKAARRLDLLEARTLRPVGGIALSGPTGHEVAAIGASAYVPIYGSGVVGALAGRGETVDVLDLARRSVARTVELPPGAHPHDVRALKDGRLLLTCEGRSSVAVLDTHTGALQEIRLPFPTGHMVCVAPDGHKAWVVHVRPGVVVEVDLVAGEPLRHLHVAMALHRATLDVEGRRLFAAEQHGPHLAELDLTAMTVTGRIQLPGTAFGLAATPDGTRLVVALRERSSLAVVDLSTRRVVDELRMPERPQSVLVDAVGGHAYVSCTPADRVIAVDLEANRIVASSSVGAGADGLATSQPL